MIKCSLKKADLAGNSKRLSCADADVTSPIRFTTVL